MNTTISSNPTLNPFMKSPRAVQTNVTSILKILQCSNLGGMEQVTFDLMRDLHASGDFHFRVMTPRHFGDGEMMFRQIDPQALDFDYKGKYGWRSFPKFRQAVREQAKDSDRIWITGTCACSLAAARSLKQPVILSHHFPHFEDRTSLLKWFGFYHLLCRRLQAITYPTEFTRAEALVVAPWLKDKTHVVRHGYTVHFVDEESRLQARSEARQKLGLPEDALIIGNAGWLIPRKRFDVFLETAARVRQKIPNAHFVICGGGPHEKELRAHAHRLGLTDAVHFAGWVRDITLYYQAWDVCLFNSDADSFGRTPVEAACHGCLAVASVPYGGLGEFLIHNENGIFLHQHNADLLAREIISLWHEPERAKGFRVAAVEKLRSEYDPAASVAQIRALLNQ